jgi:hypothetical protein
MSADAQCARHTVAGIRSDGVIPCVINGEWTHQEHQGLQQLRFTALASTLLGLCVKSSQVNALFQRVRAPQDCNASEATTATTATNF